LGRRARLRLLRRMPLRQWQVRLSLLRRTPLLPLGHRRVLLLPPLGCRDVGLMLRILLWRLRRVLRGPDGVRHPRRGATARTRWDGRVT
jgi:hypothetical protein